MQATSIQSFRALANKIHPQLPLTARESSQLLNLLTLSFQQSLDRHHPSGISTAETSINGTSSALKADKVAAPILNPSHLRQPDSQRAADAHMRALLSSPLLARKSRAASFSKCGTTQSNHVQMSKNPLDWLHDKIASATVTLEDISSCLNTIWHSNLVVHERDQVIKTVKPASKIVSWLRTSGQIHTMAILGSQRPHKNNRPHLLANMLVLEERQDIILDWLKIESGKPVLYGPVLVNHWLHAEIAHGSGLQGAMKIVLDIFGNSATLSRNMIRACEAAIMPHIKNSAASVDADLYGNFSAALMKSLTWAPSRERDAAFLALCHPATPSSANGLGYVRNLTAKPVAETSAFSVANTRMHIEFCLELANVLIAEDQHENAKFVLQFTQTRFPQYLGIEAVVAAPAEEKRAKLQEDEAANIQQLDGLLAL